MHVARRRGEDFLLFLVILWMMPFWCGVCEGNHDAKRLYDDLMRKRQYNKNIRPVAYSNETLTVNMGLKLTQLVDVEWEDHFLRWDPVEYGQLKEIYIPSELIWKPDIVLYNNADGNFTVTIMDKATVMYTGKVIWVPPAIYKSQCDMNVEYFPFDQQNCDLKFGSWTYDGFKVDIRHVWNGADDMAKVDEGIDLKHYYRSVEWDIMSVPSIKHVRKYPCCREPYPDITFSIVIRRKTLFYAINLIIPCLSLNLLTLFGFYLPCGCGEKMSVCVTILLALTIFQLLLIELVPPTSLNVPLIGKLITFTTASVFMSIIGQVFVLNMSHKSAPQEIPEYIRKVFMQCMPKFLFMHIPPMEDLDRGLGFDLDNARSDLSDYVNPYRNKFKRHSCTGILSSSVNMTSAFIGLAPKKPALNFCQACYTKRIKSYPPSILKAFNGVNFIAKHWKDDDDVSVIREEWRYFGMVIDRLLFWIYFTVLVIGATAVILKAPVLYDRKGPLA